MFLGRGDSLVRHVIQTRHEGAELMCRAGVFSTTVGLVLGLMTSVGHAQLDGLYEFDGGGDGTSWDDATNEELRGLAAQCLVHDRHSSSQANRSEREIDEMRAAGR